MTNTPRLGLLKPAPTDSVDVVAQIDNNYDVIDAAIGTIVCTSTTRPATPYDGQTIRETDTGLHYIWIFGGGPGAWVQTTRGSLICTSTTRPSVGLFNGLTIYETDTGLSYIRSGGWVAYTKQIVVCTSTTRPAEPQVGTLLYETDSSDYVICLSTTGPVWVVLERGYVYGGKDIVHSNALTATGNNNTEVLINNMDSGAMDLLPNSRYRIHSRWCAVPSGAIGTTLPTVTSFMVRIRDTNVSGAIRAEARVEVLTTLAGTVLHGEVTGYYETTAAESGKLWVFTAQRITTTAGPILTFQGDGTNVRKGTEVFLEGHNAQLTQVIT